MSMGEVGWVWDRGEGRVLVHVRRCVGGGLVVKRLHGPGKEHKGLVRTRVQAGWPAVVCALHAASTSGAGASLSHTHKRIYTCTHTHTHTRTHSTEQAQAWH